MKAQQLVGSVKIISLVDNITYKRGLKAEHGLSFLIKLPDCHIIFDIGQTDLLIHNARELGEDLSKVDHVIISHGHYDHTGGLQAFMQLNSHAVIWMKRDALQTKYSLSTGEVTEIGIPFDMTPYLHRVRFVDEVAQPVPGVFLLGKISMITTYETVNSKLQVGELSSLEPDEFDDEMVLYMIHNQKLIVVAGCAHRGIINTLNAVAQHALITQFSLVVGGTHLNGMPQHRLTATTQALAAMSIDSLMPCHCTGIHAYHHLSTNLSYHVAYAQTGSVIKVG